MGSTISQAGGPGLCKILDDYELAREPPIKQHSSMVPAVFVWL